MLKQSEEDLQDTHKESSENIFERVEKIFHGIFLLYGNVLSRLYHISGRLCKQNKEGHKAPPYLMRKY